MKEKKEMRIEMLERRKNLTKDRKEIYDRGICEKINFLIDLDAIQVVHTFLPMEDEINLYPMITDLLYRGIKVISPKALPKRQMENRVLKSLGSLENGIFGTRHPKEEEVYEGKVDLIIIPGLAFDADCFRLGYGSGYYDTFLSSQPEAFKLGICYPFQVIDKVPTEHHDVKLDGLFY